MCNRKATSALAALIFAQSGFDDPSCLIELPPINGWGYLFWAIEITLVIAFLFWVWVGPGARQLATFLSGLSKKQPISQTLVKLGAAAMALGLIVIVCIEVARLVRPYCEAA